MQHNFLNMFSSFESSKFCCNLLICQVQHKRLCSIGPTEQPRWWHQCRDHDSCSSCCCRSWHRLLCHAATNTSTAARPRTAKPAPARNLLRWWLADKPDRLDSLGSAVLNPTWPHSGCHLSSVVHTEDVYGRGCNIFRKRTKRRRRITRPHLKEDRVWDDLKVEVVFTTALPEEASRKRPRDLEENVETKVQSNEAKVEMLWRQNCHEN